MMSNGTGSSTMTAMARRRPDLGIPQRTRPGVIEVLLESAEGLVQTVAVDVVPPVVAALDVDAVVQRIDIAAILERVDLDSLLEKVDINALLERVDIDALLARTELGAVASRSATAVASRALDVVRSQGVGLDGFIGRWTARLLRRADQDGPTGPALLVTDPNRVTP
jgi:hypothetical protein